MPRAVLYRRGRWPPSSDLPRFNDSPIPRPTAPTCPLTPWRAHARRTEEEAVRRPGKTGESANGERQAAGATPSRSTLARPGSDQPESPEMGVLRPLARTLIELALELEHEDEEDERWTR